MSFADLGNMGCCVIFLKFGCAFFQVSSVLCGDYKNVLLACCVALVMSTYETCRLNISLNICGKQARASPEKEFPVIMHSLHTKYKKRLTKGGDVGCCCLLEDNFSDNRWMGPVTPVVQSIWIEQLSLSTAIHCSPRTIPHTHWSGIPIVGQKLKRRINHAVSTHHKHISNRRVHCFGTNSFWARADLPFSLPGCLKHSQNVWIRTATVHKMNVCVGWEGGTQTKIVSSWKVQKIEALLKQRVRFVWPSYWADLHRHSPLQSCFDLLTNAVVDLHTLLWQPSRQFIAVTMRVAFWWETSVAATVTFGRFRPKYVTHGNDGNGGKIEKEGTTQHEFSVLNNRKERQQRAALRSLLGRWELQGFWSPWPQKVLEIMLKQGTNQRANTRKCPFAGCVRFTQQKVSKSPRIFEIQSQLHSFNENPRQVWWLAYIQTPPPHHPTDSHVIPQLLTSADLSETFCYLKSQLPQTIRKSWGLKRPVKTGKCPTTKEKLLKTLCHSHCLTPATCSLGNYVLTLEVSKFLEELKEILRRSICGSSLKLVEERQACSVIALVSRASAPNRLSGKCQG